MKRTIQFYTLAASIATASLLPTSCSKDATIEPAKEIEFSLGDNLNLSYGEQTQVALPTSLFDNSSLSLSLDFEETANIKLSASITLHQQMEQAITLDQQNQVININSALLYPNGEVSTVSGQTIPNEYKISLAAISPDGVVLGKDAIALTISKGKISIKGVQEDKGSFFSYALYNSQPTFQLDALNIPTENTTWVLKDNEANKGLITIEDGQIKFTNDAGDPEKQKEYSYYLEPMLLKDGIAVATTTFKVNFIPEIKFLFGQYYPDLDLTINLSLIHIALGNGYVSNTPILYPEEYKSTFSLLSITKDGSLFSNTKDIFTVNAETGVISVKNDTSLTAGSYKVSIQATTTTGHQFETTLTLVMAEG